MCVGWSVGRLVYPHVFFQIVAGVDTKRGHIGMCNGRSAQQESLERCSQRTVCLQGNAKIYTDVCISCES